MLIAAAAFLLAAVHAFGAKLRFIHYVPRSKWLSFAGGVSVAYVFIHLLPEVARSADALSEAVSVEFLGESAAWLLALLGLVLFYGAEVLAREREGREKSEDIVFWFSIGTYAVYNGLVAYLLHGRREEGLDSLIIFSVAMALHFLVNDFALRDHHKHRYSSVGRWVLIAAVVVGAVAGSFAELSESTVGAVVAFVGGGVVLNVLKEELPTEASSSFGAFVAGVASYTALLLML